VRNRQATTVALAELIATLSPRQRERATARLRSIARELESLHRERKG
jgi:ribosomal protein L18E